MSLAQIKKHIQEQRFVCPKCKMPVKEFDNVVETTASVWDGAGDSNLETGASKVTLICGNKPCSWKERTEYWENYLTD